MKAGLYNPNFQDCAQYGCQATLMYLFTPDNNFKLWKEYFQYMNNFQPVLKEEILRSLDMPIKPIIEQDPRRALTKPVLTDVVSSNGKSIITKNV